MIPTKILCLSPVVLLAACISLPEVEPSPPPNLTLTLLSPSGTTYTKGPVSVQLQLQGDTPEQVKLLVDDQPLTTLQAPYTFTWDTTATPEGSHQLAARARLRDATVASEIREVVVDRTPPTVLTLSPAPLSQNVSVRQPIQATFSEQLQVGTLTSSSVKLRVNNASASSALSLSFSTQDNTLTVTPTVLITAGSTCQIDLASSITDLAGNALSPHSSAWFFQMPAWLGFGTLFSRGGTTSGYLSPDLQIDPQGQPVVLWREKSNTDSTSNLYVQRYVTGQGWQPLGGPINSTPISSNYSSKPLFQALRLDSSGNPFVAWIQPDGPTPGIVVKTWKNNEWVALGTPPTITYPSAPTTLPQSLAFKLSSNNTPYIAWLQSDTLRSQSYIYVSNQLPDQTWHTPNDQISINYSTEALPISMDFLGGDPQQPMITWEAPEGVLVAYFEDAWRYLPTTQVHPEASTPTASPSLLYVRGLGYAVVAFTEFDGTSQNIHVQEFTGSAWQPIGDALSAFPGDSPTMNLRASKDGSGNLFIMWEEKDPSSGLFRKQFRRWRQDGTTWETVGAPPANDADLLAPAFNVDASGTPFLAWVYGFPMTLNVYRFNQ